MTTNKMTAQDRCYADNLIKLFLTPEALPVSCSIGGRCIRGIPNAAVSTCSETAGVSRIAFSGMDEVSQIAFKAECAVYRDFPVLEWTVWLTNTGKDNSPILTDFYGMDAVLPGKNPAVYLNNGDTCRYDLFTETCYPLRDSGKLSQRPDGGRASDCAWPYSRVLCDGLGYILSVGWPGQWEASWEAEGEGFRFTAKQQYLRTYLKPGETVRSPRMTIAIFEGGYDRSVNVWRRFMMAHIIPKEAVPVLSVCDNNGGVEFTKATEENQRNLLEKLHKSDLHPDVLWIDAGWYPCTDDDGTVSWNFTGIQDADKTRFPRGLKPVGDRCEELGIKLLMWFETERVRKGFSDDYPDSYLLWLKDERVLEKIRMVGAGPRLIQKVALYNFGDPEARKWMTDRIDSKIKEYGIKIYRQDFNFAPLYWWLQNDGEDRLGITENLYNQGYLQFWDDLLARNPGLFINSVASGGRRCDLESMARSVSFHQSDYGAGQHPISQALLTASYQWLVYCGHMAASRENEKGDYNESTDYNSFLPRNLAAENYVAHNTFAASLGFGAVGRRCAAMEDGAFAETEEGRYFKKFQSVWQKAIPYTLDSDLYVLKMTDRTNRCWHVVQFHNEDREEGILQTIRNGHSQEGTITVFPKGLAADKTYRFESPEFDRAVTVSGKTLLTAGFTVELPQRTGEIWFYKAVC